MTDAGSHEQGLADGKACLQAALGYLARGWSVIPLCPPDHVGVGREHGRKCKSKGKAPLVGWAEYQHRLATEVEVRDWWKRWPNANVGIVMGPASGLVGIDVDGAAGEQALAEFITGMGHEQMLEFRTPGGDGGRRLLFTLPDGFLFAPGFERLLKGQELRILGHGSQTVAPPSRHESGGTYEWIIGPDATL